jgi:hypothetical protein
MSDRPDSIDDKGTENAAVRRPSGLRRLVAWKPARLSRTGWNSILAGVAVVIAAAVVVAVAFNPWQAPNGDGAASTHAKTPSVRPTPSATPASFRVPVPGVYAGASFAGWTAQNLAAGFAISVTTTGVHSGKTAARLDAASTASASSRAALIQRVPVITGHDYTLTAWVSDPSADASIADGTPSGGTLSIDGSAVAPLPIPVHTAPAQISTSFRATSSSAVIRLTTTGPTAGLVVDDVAVTETGGNASTVANASFEQYSTAAPHITNPSMLISSQNPTLDVAWFTQSVQYKITRSDGSVAASGDAPATGGTAHISLAKAGQGIFNATVQADGKSLTAKMMVVSPPDNGATARDSRFGVFVHTTPEYQGSTPLAGMLGFGNVRIDAGWQDSEPRPGVYSFTGERANIEGTAESEGMGVLPMIGAQNRNYDHFKAPSTPAGIAAYANFAAAYVQRWHPPAIEVFNEFNQKAMNSSACGTTADCYLPLLKAVYTKVKAISPSTKIVGGVTAHADNTFIKRLLQLGGGQYLDAISVHPYHNESAPEVLATEIPATEQVIRSTAGHDIPLWITELGWASNTVGDAKQAQYLIRSEALALGAGVQQFYWYDLVQDSSRAGKGWAGDVYFGLFGNASFSSMKPAAFSQALMIRQLQGKAYSGRDTVASGSYSYVFGSGSTAVRVAWSSTTSTLAVHATGPVTTINAEGVTTTLNPVDGAVSVPLSGDPLFIKGAVTSVG